MNFLSNFYAHMLITHFSGKIPLSLLQDDEWDMKSHPYLDPTGENSMNATRKVNLSTIQFVEQRLKNVNPRFSQVKSFVFACLAHVENKQLTSNINISMQRGKKKVAGNGKIEYSLEDAFCVFDNIKNTDR